MGRRSGTYLLSVVIAMACGCAKPLPPADSRITTAPQVFYRFSSMPRIDVEDQPRAPLHLGPQERQAMERAREEFNKARAERISQAGDQAMSGRGGELTGECIVRTLVVFSPLCIFIVPAAYGLGNLLEQGRVSGREPYAAALPSEKELLAVHEQILSHVSAGGIAERLRTGPSGRAGGRPEPFPRLAITPSIVTFSAEGTFVVTFFAQGQPSPDVSWPQTEHVFHVGYDQDRQRLKSELTRGEARLAEAISATYGLWLIGGLDWRTAPSYRPISKPGSGGAPAALVEQEPQLLNHGCAPFNARVGDTYQRADGGNLAIARVLGESPACMGARPIAVEIEPG